MLGAKLPGWLGKALTLSMSEMSADHVAVTQVLDGAPACPVGLFWPGRPRS